MSARSKVVRTDIGLAILIGLAACDSNPSTPPSEGTSDGISAKDLESYHFDPSAPLIDRVKEAPDFLLMYLQDIIDTSQNSTPYIPSEEEAAVIQSNLSILPPSYLENLQKRLVGIYFINNWIGSGITDYVLDSDNEVFTFIIVNPETMRNDISEWITYKESSCFLPNGQEDSSITITVDCGNEYSGLAYVLLHETSHIMDFVHHYTPYVMAELGQSVSETDFVRGTWMDYYNPVQDADFILREDITFYGKDNGPLIHASQASELYQALGKTPFVSLYGSQNWVEDFAEYYTWYYFTAQLHQPYRIIISRDGMTEMIYEPMESDLVQERTGTPYLEKE
jgi:hypothetical protein